MHPRLKNKLGKLDLYKFNVFDMQRPSFYETSTMNVLVLLALWAFQQNNSVSKKKFKNCLISVCFQSAIKAKLMEIGVYVGK